MVAATVVTTAAVLLLEHDTATMVAPNVAPRTSAFAATPHSTAAATAITAQAAHLVASQQGRELQWCRQ